MEQFARDRTAFEAGDLNAVVVAAEVGSPYVRTMIARAPAWNTEVIGAAARAGHVGTVLEVLNYAKTQSQEEALSDHLWGEDEFWEGPLPPDDPVRSPMSDLLRLHVLTNVALLEAVKHAYVEVVLAVKTWITAIPNMCNRSVPDSLCEHAVRSGSLPLLDAVIAIGADVEGRADAEPDHAPLALACQLGREDMASALHDAGAQMDRGDILDLAIRSGNRSLVSRLLAWGARANVWTMGFALEHMPCAIEEIIASCTARKQPVPSTDFAVTNIVLKVRSDQALDLLLPHVESLFNVMEAVRWRVREDELVARIIQRSPFAVLDKCLQDDRVLQRVEFLTFVLENGLVGKDDIQRLVSMCASGPVEALKVLYKFGGRVSLCEVEKSRDPLFKACARGNLPVIEFLAVRAPDSYDIRACFGRRAIRHCIRDRLWRPLECLIRAGMQRGRRPSVEFNGPGRACDRRQHTPTRGRARFLRLRGRGI